MNDAIATPAEIVVGIDGSRSSLEALRWAARIAPLMKRDIRVVISWQYPASYGYVGTPMDYRPNEDAAHQLDISLKSVFGEEHPEGVHRSVVESHPSRALLAAAEHAEMLVVGSRGHGGFVGLLVGSVSAYCAEHASCPVVVVHGSIDDSRPEAGA